MQGRVNFTTILTCNPGNSTLGAWCCTQVLQGITLQNQFVAIIKLRRPNFSAVDYMTREPVTEVYFAYVARSNGGHLKATPRTRDIGSWHRMERSLDVDNALLSFQFGSMTAGKHD